MIRKITTPAVPEPPPGSYTNCFVANDTVYISGQHAGAPGGGLLGDGTMLDQARQALKKIKALLEAAGGHMSDIVKLTVYVTDISKRPEVSAARREFFSGDFPCSTLVEITALAEPGLTVEIEAIAVLGKK